jgi:hypothetical protein
MAGKTFPGIGDLEDESPPVDPADAADSGSGNSRPFYSGPTVVDDLKVEEGLKKLRSLDSPLGGLTGITKAVVDAIESAPISAPIDVGPPVQRPPGPPPTPAQVVANQMRETAVGRNVVGPTVGQQEIPAPFDDRALRGTLFGHSIHAPEFALPAPEEPPAPGALALLNRGAPTTPVAVYQPQRTLPPEAEPFQRPNRFRDTVFTPMEGDQTPIEVDETPPRQRLVKRVVIGAAGIAAILGVALVWTRTGDDPEGSSSSANKLPGRTAAPTPPAPAPPPPAPAATAPTAAPPPVAAPPAAAPPAAAARESEPEPIPAAEPPPAKPSPPVARPSARHSAPPSERAAEEPDPAAHPHHTHATASHVERHHETDKTDKTDKSDRNPETETPPAPAKPVRSGKRAPEDDPDATMAPSIE